MGALAVVYCLSFLGGSFPFVGTSPIFFRATSVATPFQDKGAPKSSKNKRVVSKNMSSGKGFPFQSSSNLLGTFFWCLYRKGVAIHAYLISGKWKAPVCETSGLLLSNHFSLNLCHCFGCGSDVVRMWCGRVFGCGVDVFSDLVQTVWQKLRESGLRDFRFTSLKQLYQISLISLRVPWL